MNVTADGWISAAEAAVHLGMAETATRRLFPDQIAAVKSDGEWTVRLEDVVAWRDRHAGRRMLLDLAEQSGASDHVVYRTMVRLGIEPGSDDHSGHLLLAEGDADAILAELARIDRLHERSVIVAGAARLLRSSQSSIRGGIVTGRLEADAESGSSDATFITRTSIRKELDRRGTKHRVAVSSGVSRVR